MSRTTVLHDVSKIQLFVADMTRQNSRLTLIVIFTPNLPKRGCEYGKRAERSWPNLLIGYLTLKIEACIRVRDRHIHASPELLG